jgi:D-proline reductase (dithiol) PrdB
MPLEYLPIMAQNSAPKPPRELASPSKPTWCPLKKPVSESRVALLSSAALRLAFQEPFVPREDLSYRRVASDPAAGDIVIDHHSGIGRVPKEDPEIVFPRTALTNLEDKRIVGALSPFHLSFMGGVRRHRDIEDDLAPALAQELEQAEVDLALLVPY